MKFNLRRVAVLSVMGALSVVVAVETVITASSLHAGFQADFRGDLYAAAHSIVSGANPYHPALLAREAAVAAAGGHWGLTISPRYPPVSMLAVVPLSMLPFTFAGVLFIVASGAALMVALWLLDVRDPRCYAVAAISAPAAYGIWIGQLTPWLLLGTALMWRARDSRRTMPAATACAIAVKLFLWPLAVWLLITRRYRQFAVTVALTIMLLLGSWAVIDFDGLASYPRLLANVAYIGELRGSSLVTELLRLGFSTWLARSLALACACALFAAAAAMVSRPDGQQRAFGLVVLAALVASPVVWVHSMLLLFVPIALISPRLSLFWFVPALATFSAGIDVALEAVVAGVVCAPLIRTRANAATRTLMPGKRLQLAGAWLAPI